MKNKIDRYIYVYIIYMLVLYRYVNSHPKPPRQYHQLSIKFLFSLARDLGLSCCRLKLMNKWIRHHDKSTGSRSESTCGEGSSPALKLGSMSLQNICVGTGSAYLFLSYSKIENLEGAFAPKKIWRRGGGITLIQPPPPTIPLWIRLCCWVSVCGVVQTPLLVCPSECNFLFTTYLEAVLRN